MFRRLVWSIIDYVWRVQILIQPIFASCGKYFREVEKASHNCKNVIVRGEGVHEDVLHTIAAYLLTIV